MQRSSIIATVIAAGGVLIAGSVASVAVISAASTGQSGSETVALVATEATPSAESTSDAEATSTQIPSPDLTSAPAPAPTMSAEELPELPEVVAVAPTSPNAGNGGQPADTRTQATRKPRPTPSASHTASSEPSISADQARRAVLKGTDGSVISVARTNHGGYAAWAVKVQRPDGSVVTGYAARSNGAVYDWVVNKKAPVVAASSSASHSDDDHEDDHEDDHSEGHGGDDD